MNQKIAPPSIARWVLPCVGALLAVVATVASAAPSVPALSNASKFTVHGTSSAGGCVYTGAPSASLNVSEPGTVEIRLVNNDPQSCTQTWERGTPSAAQLEAENVTLASPQLSTKAVAASRRAQRHAPRARAAGDEHAAYVYARTHDGSGNVNSGANASLNWHNNGCVYGGFKETHYYYGIDGVSLVSHNEHYAVECAQAYNSDYADFSNTGCNMEYNRTAVFARSSGKVDGYWPAYGCYLGSYAGFLTVKY
jgi:hypothetical protein